MRQQTNLISDQINHTSNKHSISMLEFDMIHNRIRFQRFKSLKNRESLGINNRFINSLNIEGT